MEYVLILILAALVWIGQNAAKIYDDLHWLREHAEQKDINRRADEAE